MWFGDWVNQGAADMAKLAVRSVDNFNWTFIFILAVVAFIYGTELKNKNYKGIVAGLSLYMVHWFYEIMNAVIGGVSGYALWTVSPESTSYVLLIGVSWELSMMFSIAALGLSKILPKDPKEKILGINNRWFFCYRQRRHLRSDRSISGHHSCIYLGLSLVGSHSRIHHGLHSVFPGRLPGTGYKAEVPEDFYRRVGGHQRLAAHCIDTVGYNLENKRYQQ